MQLNRSGRAQPTGRQPHALAKGPLTSTRPLAPRHDCQRAISTPALATDELAATATFQPRTGGLDAAAGRAALLAFTQWALSNQVRFSGVRPEARGVRGVFATAPLQPGELLVSVPLEVRTLQPAARQRQYRA
jgi:hypothetical protein